MGIVIAGSGSFIPTSRVLNKDFASHEFLNEDGSPFKQDHELIAQKFKEITGIESRRYIDNSMTNSDIAALASDQAIQDSGIDPETLDYIIFAHNFGDVRHGAIQSDLVPSLATRVKHALKIKNTSCVAYDILFGCPGWVEAVIQSMAFIKAGMAKSCLAIGSETLSRVVDAHDRDSMIYADGAGATVITSEDSDRGILATHTGTYAFEEAYFLFYGQSYNQELDPNTRYLKMYGRKIYEFALNHVPQAMKTCLDKSGIPITDVKKILIHQANEKMDDAIINRFYKLYNMKAPNGIMPMSIHELGNSSVATVPTLYDSLVRGQLEGHEVNAGDIILFASVGAGMNINAIVYRY